jgi:hypothetical protein
MYFIRLHAALYPNSYLYYIYIYIYIYDTKNFGPTGHLQVHKFVLHSRSSYVNCYCRGLFTFILFSHARFRILRFFAVKFTLVLVRGSHKCVRVAESVLSCLVLGHRVCGVTFLRNVWINLRYWRKYITISNLISFTWTQGDVAFDSYFFLSSQLSFNILCFRKEESISCIHTAYIHFYGSFLKCYGPANLSLHINLFLMHHQFDFVSSKGVDFVVTLRSVLCFWTRVCQSPVTNDCLKLGPFGSDMAKERVIQQECSSLFSHNAAIAPRYRPEHICMRNVPKTHINIILQLTPKSP